MTEIVVNRCHGGFSISAEALYRLAGLKGLTLYPGEESKYGVYWTISEKPSGFLSDDEFYQATREEKEESNRLYKKFTFNSRPEDRADPDLVRVVEELGESAYGRCAELEIVEVPDDVEWQIEEYDGFEWVAEKHRTW